MVGCVQHQCPHWDNSMQCCVTRIYAISNPEMQFPGQQSFTKLSHLKGKKKKKEQASTTFVDPIIQPLSSSSLIDLKSNSDLIRLKGGSSFWQRKCFPQKNVFQIAKTKSGKSKTQMKNNCHI